jgi:hypothetical protein
VSRFVIGEALDGCWDAGHQEGRNLLPWQILAFDCAPFGTEIQPSELNPHYGPAVRGDDPQGSVNFEQELGV